MNFVIWVLDIIINLALYKTHLAGKGRKALFAMYSKCKPLSLNCKTMLDHFDTYITSILFYSCQVWRFSKGNEMKKLHLEFCKRLLCVKKSTCYVMVYFELGRIPIEHICIYRMIKYRFKLLSTRNSILKEAYTVAFNLAETNSFQVNWISFIKNKLMTLCFVNLWLSQPIVNDKYSSPLIETRIFDQAKESLFSMLYNYPKSILYKQLVERVCLQYYLQKYIPKHNPILLIRLRLSTHSLAIETGRHRNTEKSNGLCIYCNLNIVEDEYYMLLECPTYNNIRRKYIKPFYWKKPSTFKIVLL